MGSAQRRVEAPLIRRCLLQSAGQCLPGTAVERPDRGTRAAASRQVPHNQPWIQARHGAEHRLICASRQVGAAIRCGWQEIPKVDAILYGVRAE